MLLNYLRVLLIHILVHSNDCHMFTPHLLSAFLIEVFEDRSGELDVLLRRAAIRHILDLEIIHHLIGELVGLQSS